MHPTIARMQIELELMQAGIPWGAIQEMPVERVYLYKAFLEQMAEEMKQRADLEHMGGR